VYAASDALWRGIEDVPGVGGTIAARWARREGPVAGPLAGFSQLLMNLWGVLHTPDEIDDEATRTVRHCLAAADGLLTAPTAQTAYDLVLPHL